MPTVAALIVAAAAIATQRPRPHLEAVRTEDPPIIDGRLDDPAWKAAFPSADFTQKTPVEGRPPRERTTVRVLYDDDALYVGVDCEQRHARIVRPLARRDTLLESDHVEIDLDSRRDHRSAFAFIVTAAGVRIDAIRFDDLGWSSDWDDVWDARVHVHPGGWSAELRIPLRILRYDDLPVQSWGLQVRRHVSQTLENDEWAFIPRAAAGEVSRYGSLDGLVDLPVRRPLALKPFVLGRLRRRDPGLETAASGVDASLSAGLDLEWHPTQNLTLAATLLPDFAQVEADQQVLNLTSYQTYFPEKRPFFLGGIEAFSTPFPLVYTRRIGRLPAAPELLRGAAHAERLYDTPEPSRILGAQKLVGRLGRGWTVGVLGALAGRNDVSVLGADGSRTERLAEPLTAFHAFRLRHDVASRTQVGVLVTGTTRAEPTGDYPVPESGAPGRALCPGGAVVGRGARCFHDAWVAGTDLHWRSPQGDWVASGQAIASLVSGGPPRTMRDGIVVASGDVGGGGFLYFAKEGGTPWVGSVQWNRSTRRLDFDDMGFMVRQNLDEVHAALEHRVLQGEGLARERYVRLTGFESLTLDGVDLGRGGALTSTWVLRDYARVWADVHGQLQRWDDREIGDGAIFQRPALIAARLGASTDPRRRASASLEVNAESLAEGWAFSANGLASYRPLPQLALELVPQVIVAAGEPRFVSGAPEPGEYLFGALLARSVGATVRASWTFTPHLSLQSYAQLFLAAGHYDEFRAFRGAPGAPPPRIALSSLTPAPPPATNPDFEQGALNVNVVVRWDYGPGSSIYGVWSRAQTPATAVLPGEAARLDPAAVRRAPASDVVLLKLTYWWG